MNSSEVGRVHRAAHFLAAKFPAKAKKVVVESHVLSPFEANALESALPLDANDYYYSSCISIIDGLRAIEADFFTWSTVKLYYAVFYSLRAILALEKIAVFWAPEGGPYHVVARPGANPGWLPGKGTHKPILDGFGNLLPNHFLLSQEIELLDGPQWMADKRENANYHESRFCEPDVPDHYLKIVQLGIRKVVLAYLDRTSRLLTFDKDHAIVSYPLATLQVTGDLIKAHGGADFSADELLFMKRKCRERSGSLSPLMTYISSTLKR